jgi:hypothetical protein
VEPWEALALPVSPLQIMESLGAGGPCRDLKDWEIKGSMGRI